MSKFRLRITGDIGMEIYVPIDNYEGYFEASNYGNIRSLNRVILRNDGNVLPLTGRIMKLKKEKTGYNRIMLRKNATKKVFFVHRLIYETFIGKIPNGYEINHKDENKSNNAVCNLEIVTHSENINYGTRNKRVSEKLINRCGAKKIIQYDLNGNFIKEWASQKEIERQLGIRQSYLTTVIKKGYTALESKWKFK